MLSNALNPETVYHFKVVAANGKGTSEGNDQSFETLPAVFGLSTDPATNIKTRTADLNGSFTGDGFDTTYYFEWGSSTLYGNTTASGEVTSPSGATAVPPIGIEELQPLHTYHYRIVAENSFGVTKGPDATFTTFTAPVIVSISTSKVTGSLRRPPRGDQPPWRRSRIPLRIRAHGRLRDHRAASRTRRSRRVKSTKP